MGECKKAKQELDAQQEHWDKTYSEEPDFFGEEPSWTARKAAEAFKREGKFRILEIGAGQGRDALFFAKSGFSVQALDYSESAVGTINSKAQQMGLSEKISAICHDIRKPLPFDDAAFDAVYCHMLYCMALCTGELEALFQEVRRVLKPHGLSIYTVRNTNDPHYRKGKHITEDIYENAGFIVHFFSEEKIKQLSKGYTILEISEFEEGELPRRLFFVTLKKNQ